VSAPDSQVAAAAGLDRRVVTGRYLLKNDALEGLDKIIAANGK